MKIQRQWKATLISLFFATLTVYASELSIYRDGAILRYRPAGGFIGWTGSDTKASCGGETIALVPTDCCPDTLRLCRERNAIDRQFDVARKAERAEEVLNTLVGHIRYDRIESGKMVKEAEKVADALSGFHKRSQEAYRRAKGLEVGFKRQTRSMEGYRLARACQKELILKLPSDAITFEVLNIADIADKKQIALREAMAVKNRSGIDIRADSVRFFYRRIHRMLHPIRFSAWVIGEGNRRARILYAKAAQPIALADEAATPKVEVKGPRRFEAHNVVLPSTGARKEIVLRRRKIAAEYEERAYPWRSREVFETVAFKPPYPVVNDRWRILDGDRVVTEQVYGGYEGGKYRIFLSTDEDLIVRRDRLILKESESFFGNRIHKKDGYTLTLTNQSKRSKRLHIVERIPVAVRSDVDVKLLKVRSDLPLKYRRGEKGRLDIDVTIPPKKSGKIEVLFEVDFDKKKPVYY